MPDALGSVGVEPYIECVFENDLVELDAAQTLAAAEANEHTLITAETRRLHLAGHWADLHPGDAVVQSRLPGTEHPVQLGGDGTPTVGDFAPAELGCVLRVSDGSACRLIADALDLRHRLRSIWTAAQAGSGAGLSGPPHRLSHPAFDRRAGRSSGCPVGAVIGGGVVGTATNPAGGRHHPGRPGRRRTASRIGGAGAVCAARPGFRAWVEVDHCPGHGW